MSVRKRLLLCVFISSWTQADTDWKTYSATGCVPDGKRKSGSNVIAYDGFGGICNRSRDKHIDIVCPVIRDFSRSRMPIEVKHSGRSGNQNVDLTCTLRNMKTHHQDGGSNMAAFFASLTPIAIHSTERFTIRHVITDLQQSSIDSHNFGATILTCRLPKSYNSVNGKDVTSCLYNYSIREWDGQ